MNQNALLYNDLILITAPSSPPSSFEAMVLSATSIFFTWEPPLPEYHNGIIRRYIVVLDSQDLSIKIRSYTSETSVTVSNLHPYTVYLCTVAAETVLTGVESDVYVTQTHEAG